MLFFWLAVLISFVCTLIVKKIAIKLNVFDRPDGDRKKHRSPVPLLGGVAIFVSFWLVFILAVFSKAIIFLNFSVKQIVLLFLASLILMIVGFFDDKIKLRYDWRLLFSALAIILVLAGGVNFDGITNPFGGTIGLDFIKLNSTIFGNIFVGAYVLAFLWLIGMIFTMKILDGLDGLSAGISSVGAFSIAILAGEGSRFFQPDVAVFAWILAGATIGFLFLNFYPAKIFLGEGGGQFLGLMLGVLSILAGSKIATTLLVMILPITDLFLVIIERKLAGQPVSSGDRRHLHFRLLDYGFPHFLAVLFFYFMAALFGLSAIYMSSFYKMIFLSFLLVFFVIFKISLLKIYEKKR